MANNSKKRNALEELAEYLKMMPCDSPADEPYVDKAQCIIAELAKIQNEEDALYSMANITAEEARNIVRQRIGNCMLKCRAIAEEGAEDGRR